MSLDVVTFGEAMLLLVADRPGALENSESFIKRTAGAETNVAIGLARLGLSVGWVSRLGTDSMGKYLLRELTREGVDCSHVTCDPAQRTGMMFKGRVEGGGDPQVEYHRKGSAASLMQPQDIDDRWLASARHLHATGIFPALSANCMATTKRSMALMREAGRTISFDPNLRPSLWPSEDHMRSALNSLAANVDWVLPVIEEGKLLTGAVDAPGVARFYLDLGAKLVVVKLGPEGAYFADESSSAYVPGYPVKQVVDTVGAGDAFAVGMISAMLDGLDTFSAVRRGTQLGALAVQVLGDTEGLPTRAQLASTAF